MEPGKERLEKDGSLSGTPFQVPCFFRVKSSGGPEDATTRWLLHHTPLAVPFAKVRQYMAVSIN